MGANWRAVMPLVIGFGLYFGILAAAAPGMLTTAIYGWPVDSANYAYEAPPLPDSAHDRIVDGQLMESMRLIFETNREPPNIAGSVGLKVEPLVVTCSGQVTLVSATANGFFDGVIKVRTAYDAAKLEPGVTRLLNMDGDRFIFSTGEHIVIAESKHSEITVDAVYLGEPGACTVHGILDGDSARAGSLTDCLDAAISRFGAGESEPALGLDLAACRAAGQTHAAEPAGNSAADLGCVAAVAESYGRHGDPERLAAEIEGCS